MNPFELFNLQPGYSLDHEELENQYLELIKKAHPDNFLSEIEKIQAMHVTISINDAFAQLKNPLQRARILLELCNIELEKKTPSHILFEMLELQDRQDKIEEIVVLARVLFANAFEEKNYEAMAYQFHRLQYLEKMKCSYKSPQGPQKNQNQKL